MTKLDHALALAAKGFKVFPIAPNAKAPPLLNGWPQKATDNPDLIREYWLPMPDANIGIHCEGMIVVDVDVAKGGDASLLALELQHGFPETLTAHTPTGGRHIFLRHAAGCSNGVSVLGPGLDVRSHGGYVVGCGSTVPAGSYHWAMDGLIADAPDWLVLKLGTNVPKTSTAAPVADAADDVVDRATTWLAAQPGAIEGQGGDAHTFKVACGLRDRGVSREQAEALMLDWNATCAPPWGTDELRIKIANAYRYAENEPGVRVAMPSEFQADVAQSAQSAPVVKDKQQAKRLAEFAAIRQSGPGYLVKGLLQKGTYAQLFGAPGEGKTFVSLDLAYCVAAGRPWMEHKVKAGLVLYLAYEGIGGLVKRAQALRKRYGEADVPLYVQGAAYSLRDAAGRQDLAALLATLPAKPALIVIDTLARALMGGDENSAQDVGAFNQAVAMLIQDTGACVMTVHHSGKNKAAGARGSSALLGAIDTELEVDAGRVRASKQRDIELGEPIGFILKPVIVGVDEDGDELTSCVVEAGIAAAPTATLLRGKPKLAFDVLCDLAPDNAPVTETQWRQKCAEFIKGNDTWYKTKRSLLKSGSVVQDDSGRFLRSMR